MSQHKDSRNRVSHAFGREAKLRAVAREIVKALGGNSFSVQLYPFQQGIGHCPPLMRSTSKYLMNQSQTAPRNLSKHVQLIASRSALGRRCVVADCNSKRYIASARFCIGLCLVHDKRNIRVSSPMASASPILPQNSNRLLSAFARRNLQFDSCSVSFRNPAFREMKGNAEKGRLTSEATNGQL
jgi:hypothetical protein